MTNMNKPNKDLEYAKEKFKNSPIMGSISFSNDEGERVYFKRHWLFGIIQTTQKKMNKSKGARFYFGD